MVFEFLLAIMNSRFLLSNTSAQRLRPWVLGIAPWVLRISTRRG